METISPRKQKKRNVESKFIGNKSISINTLAKNFFLKVFDRCVLGEFRVSADRKRKHEREIQEGGKQVFLSLFQDKGCVIVYISNGI